MNAAARDLLRPGRPGRSMLAAVLVACEAAPPGPPFVPQYETEHLRIGTAAGVEICAGTLDVWERHVEFLAEELGFTREFAWLVLYDDAQKDALTADCGADFGEDLLAGCWDGRVARATLASAGHELVHAWAGVADPIPLLREGVAERMEGTVQRPGAVVVLDELLQTERLLPEDRYGQAGHFVAWLIDEYGPERFVELYRRARRGGSEAALSAIVHEVLGEEPEQVLARHAEAARVYYPGVGPLACGAGERVAWQGDRATWRAHGSCVDGPWLGTDDPAAAKNYSWQRWAIEVPVAGAYVLDTGNRAGSITRCLAAATDEAALTPSPDPVADDWVRREPLDPGAGVTDWPDRVLTLVPGVYDVWVLREASELELVTPLDLSLTRL